MTSFGDDAELLSPEESLDDDELDDEDGAGFSPPDRPWGSSAWGTTEREAAEREDLDHRLAREQREDDADDGDGVGDCVGTDGELLDDQVGSLRSGRLVLADAVVDDERSDLWAQDVGIDGAGASAEEAAVHLVADDDG
ncbi:MAG TPA: DUF5709 domain-containing protein [Mycobacteriales bacterium]